MSQNIELSGRFTLANLDVFASITTQETEPHNVHWRFVIPQGIQVLHGGPLEGDFQMKPGELHSVGITLDFTTLSPAQMNQAKLKLLKVDTTIGSTNATVGFKSDGDTKTIEQLCDSARRSREPFGR